jgi:hypothetical protein
VRTSGEGLSRLIRRLAQAQREFTQRGGAVDAPELLKATTLIEATLDADETEPET